MTIIISSDIEGDLTTSDFILGDATTINYHEESENEELHIIYPENFIQSEPPRDPDSVSVWDAPPTTPAPPGLVEDYQSTQQPRTESSEQEPSTLATIRDEQNYSSDQGLGVVLGRYHPMMINLCKIHLHLFQSDRARQVLLLKA